MKKKIPLIVVNALLLLAFAACLIASGSIRGMLLSQRAAKAWAGQSGERFAQVSVFLPADFTFDDSSVQAMRGAADAAILAASLETPENGELYTDAWSASGKLSVQGSRGTAYDISVLGVGGDFFLFHPLELRDGSYLHPDDLMSDRVVLDEELAWRLFGSTELAGLEVKIDGVPYLIAGVVSREDDSASARAYTGGAGMFMSFEALKKLDGTTISCYEIVMPDPISGFALKTMTDASPGEGAEIVENTGRYSTGELLDVALSFGERSMRTSAVTYPYWENAARYTEDWLALLLVLELALIICPIVCAVIYGVKAVRFLAARGRHAAAERVEAKDEREAEKYELEHPDEFVVPDVEDIVREVLEEREREESEIK